MWDVWLSNNQSFNDYVFYLEPYFLSISSLVLKYSKDSCQASFMTLLTLTRILFSLFISIILFVDCIVCQMHEEVVHISCCWFSVRFSAEPCHTLLVYVYSKRIHTVKKHINPEIILQVLNEMRVVDVMLDHKTAETFILLRSLDWIEDCLHFTT